MIPTNLPIINEVIPFVLPNVNYYLGEFFIHAIDYTGNFIPYYISNYCRIFSPYVNRLMSPSLDEGGYYRINIIKGDGNKIFTGVHKLGLQSFNPIMETDLFVPDHKDGNKQNNFIGNLEWVTVSINTRRALDMGLSDCKGENNSRSYLSNETVHDICKMLEENIEPSRILDELGYTEYGPERYRVAAIIRHIRRGQTYLDIGSQYDIPGLKGRRYYGPEFTELVCNFLNAEKPIKLSELCELLQIPLEDRKLFRNYVDAILKGRCDTHISKKFNNLKKYINDITKENPLYVYYN